MTAAVKPPIRSPLSDPARREARSPGGRVVGDTPTSGGITLTSRKARPSPSGGLVGAPTEEAGFVTSSATAEQERPKVAQHRSAVTGFARVARRGPPGPGGL